MFFIQVLQVDFLADFQFTLVYTGLLFLPPDVQMEPRLIFQILICPIPNNQRQIHGSS